MSESESNTRVRLGITMGDPAGVGPEVVLKSLNSGDIPQDLDLILFSNTFLLRDQAGYLGLSSVVQQVQMLSIAGRTYQIIDPTDWGDRMIFPGKPTPDLAPGILRCIDSAVMWCLEGKIDGIVTAPLSKEVIRTGGYPGFTGHTEYLGRLTGSKRPIMMLASTKLKVLLATTHVPIQDIITELSPERLVEAMVTAHNWFVEFFDRKPVITVAALNPHCGEGGSLGSEEDTLIAPAINEARAKGISVTGPYSADTIFLRALQGEFDVVLALYHDQGMIPVKLDPYGRAVNVTLGLPIIRTSPDHGTAFTIAGKGQADHRSFHQALLYAYELAATKRLSNN